MFPNFYVLSAKKEALVAECWKGENQTWDMGIRRRFLDKELSRWAEFTENLDAI